MTRRAHRQRRFDWPPVELKLDRSTARANPRASTPEDGWLLPLPIGGRLVPVPQTPEERKPDVDDP
jgi:hypothetical protein